MTAQSLAKLNASQIQLFITELVNLQFDERDYSSIRRFARRFGPQFGFFDARVLGGLVLWDRSESGVTAMTLDFDSGLLAGVQKAEGIDWGEGNSQEWGRKVAAYLHGAFRAIWIEPSGDVREWGKAVFRINLARLRPDADRYVKQSVDEQGRLRLPLCPDTSPIDIALDYLVEHHSQTRYCPNTECVSPYFFAIRPSQRYCSELCAQTGERETKRRWWAEHGTEWRKKRIPKERDVRKQRRKTGKK